VGPEPTRVKHLSRLSRLVASATKSRLGRKDLPWTNIHELNTINDKA